MCRYLNGFKYFFVFISAISGCVSNSAFASIVRALADIGSSAVGLKICAITAEIKKYKSIIKKKHKKHDQIVLLAKTKLDTIEFLISKALIDSYINHDRFVTVNNVPRQYNEMK